MTISISLEEFKDWQPLRLPETLVSKKVLIVDDSRLQRKYLSEVFLRAGLEQVLTAEDGAEALEIMFAHRPNLIVLDIMMPKMSGFELCKLIRRHELFADIPILVQTGIDSEKERLRMFEYGASDMVTKPVHPDEIIARVREHLEKQQLTLSFRQLQHTLKEEYQAASDMQSLLEPDSLLVQEIARDYALQISGKIILSQGLGGDTWGLRHINEQECAFFMADFPGRGISTTMNLFRLQLLLNQLAPLTEDPGTLLTLLNKRIYNELPRSDYVKMLWAIYDRSTGMIRYTVAGGVRALRLSVPDGTLEEFHAPAIPLGISEDAVYKTAYMPFKNGDTILSYSDMVDSMKDPGAAHVLIQTMLEMILGHHEGDLSTRHTRLVNFIGMMTSAEANYDMPDDLTVMLLTRCE